MPRTSLTEMFKDLIRLGREVAFVQKSGYRRERWTYHQIACVAAHFAMELHERGVRTGDRVLLWGPNSMEWVAAFWGCLLRGAVAVPMDDRAATDFAQRVTEHAGVKLIVASRERPALDSAAPLLILEDLRQVVHSQPRLGAQTVAPDGKFTHTTPQFSEDRLGRDHIAEIVFTSGTTAQPRGVVITHGNILANLEPLEQGIQPYLKYERFFHPLSFVNLLPLSHVFGQFLGIFVPPLLGAAVVFEESLNPSEIVRTIRRERATLLVTVPRVLDALRRKVERDLEAQGRREWFDAKFRAAAGKKFLGRAWKFRRIHRQFGWRFWAFLSGGAALSAGTETFFNRMGYAVIQGYGLTETASLISVNHPFRVGQGSLGKILPGREIKLDENGEILVRGASIAAAYWEGGELRPAGDAGWFRTGDIGALDADGNLYFKGRKKNVIVTPAGMNVYPEDLEAALRRNAAVKDCVVVPLEQDGNSEACAVLLLKESAVNAPGAAVAVAAESRAAETVERANESLAEYQHMRRWVVWPEADFPRTSTGKPRTNVIAEAAQQALSAAGTMPDTAAGGARTRDRASVLAELIAHVTARSSEVGGAMATSSEANLETDLNLSSLDRVELMSAIEDRFQTDLNETRFTEARTVGDLEQLLQTTADRRSEYRYPRWTQRFPVTWIRAAVYYLLVWPATHILAHPRVRGRGNLRGVRGPLLIVSNHVTRRTDIGFIMAALPLRFRHRMAATIGGETLRDMRHPLREWFLLKRCAYWLGYWLVVGLFNVFPVPQQSGFRESFQFAGESVDRGYSVLVFPEGQLTSDGKLHPFQSGIGLLAKNLRLPVVPMRIDGLWEVKQTGWRFARPGKVHVTIGPPVTYPPETPPEQIARDLESRVRSL